MPPPDHEVFFRFSQRPFSLTPDSKFYFRSRSHGRVFDTLSAAVRRRESVMLVTGDLGVGKTTLCRTLMASMERNARAALVGNALLSPDDLLRLMLQDLGAVTHDGAKDRLAGLTHVELLRRFDTFLQDLSRVNDGAVMIIDEAHSLPPATMEQIVEIASFESNRGKVLQFLLAGQSSVAGGTTLPRVIDERLAVRARLLPLEHDECERYIHHRLTIAGGAAVTFQPHAVEVIYSLSGGVPRLVNLLCERSLQEAAASNANRIEATMIESAASALDLLRIRPKRFRWYGTR